jgi:NSS family neurotransmitter:Na+ symporter
MAATGFAVGMGNIWRFPYLLGENGGAAFLIVYLMCAFGIGLPLLITEISIGRRGGVSATQSAINVAAESGRSRKWGVIGTLGIFCAFVILTYYTVLSGWTLDYFVKAATGAFAGANAEQTGAMFSALLANPWVLMFWNTVVHVMIIVVIRQDLQAGLERASLILMPALFVAMFVMVLYGVFAGDMPSTLRFLLEPDFSKLSFGMLMAALGQAFFSIGIGMGSMFVFGTYMPKDYSIPQSAAYVILVDTGVALMAGFAIFPLVFAYGLNPGSGPGLVFQTLPLAFGQMPGGQFFGSIFFVLLIVAALTSCLGLAEGVTNWLEERMKVPRQKGVLWISGTAWVVGIASILGFSVWQEGWESLGLLYWIPSYDGLDIFDTLDTLAANNLLLIGGCLSAIFFGWRVPKALKLEAINVRDGLFFAFWRFMIRFVIPPVLVVALVRGIVA